MSDLQWLDGDNGESVDELIALDREVNHGGYGQFFVNSSREYAPIIVEAPRHIGCPKTAVITQTVLKIVLKTPTTPMTEMERLHRHPELVFGAKVTP